ncbi:MAG TPA: FUSC family membrane protein [Flavisolibacter sp.]
MQRQAKEIQYFLYSQAFADGFRTTLAVLLPTLIAFYFTMMDAGMTVSLGALAISLTDAPGPVVHKRNGMFVCLLLIFLMALVTPLARMDIYFLGLEILLVSFLFSMFSVYGNRATSVGNAAILVMILTMDHPVLQQEVLFHAALITTGGAWYIAISLLFYQLQPYRIAQRSLGESIREVATFLSIKSEFYNPDTDLDEDYKKLVAQQVIVNEKQDSVREILFKTRQIVSESTPTGRKLVWTFVETIDLFEDVTAIYYDYSSLRKRFAHSNILKNISGFIRQVSNELDQVGMAIQNNSQYTVLTDFDYHLRALKDEIDMMAKPGEENTLVLKKILVNLRKLVQRFNELNKYFSEAEYRKKSKTTIDHSHFVGHQPLDPIVLWNNMTLESSVFRHAMRVALACLAGYIVVKTISYGNYSYWILMTIAFILKPAFSLTKQRNIQRLIGTLAGGVAGVLILAFIPNKNIQFAFMVLFMLISYSFMRINYLVMVIFITPFVLILFSMLGVSFSEVVTERVLDTVIGCAIAFSASYFLFPTWESEQIHSRLKNMLKANAAYLKKISEGLAGKNISLLDYKLVRKEVYVSSANLSAAFQRMLSEPKAKQKSSKLIHQFVVLNHLLFSNIATVAIALLSKEPRVHPQQLQLSAGRSISLLEKSIAELGDELHVEKEKKHKPDNLVEMVGQDDNLLKDQLDFIQKLVVDIEKTVKAIGG